jgi:hypothetical protein
MWLGPPSIIRKMHRRAFAGSGGDLGAKGFSRGGAADNSFASIAVNATLPNPDPNAYKKSRRCMVHT